MSRHTHSYAGGGVAAALARHRARRVLHGGASEQRHCFRPIPTDSSRALVRGEDALPGRRQLLRRRDEFGSILALEARHDV